MGTARCLPGTNRTDQSHHPGGWGMRRQPHTSSMDRPQCTAPCMYNRCMRCPQLWVQESATVTVQGMAQGWAKMKVLLMEQALETTVLKFRHSHWKKLPLPPPRPPLSSSAPPAPLHTRRGCHTIQGRCVPIPSPPPSCTSQSAAFGVGQHSAGTIPHRTPFGSSAPTGSSPSGTSSQDCRCHLAAPAQCLPSSHPHTGRSGPPHTPDTGCSPQTPPAAHPPGSPGSCSSHIHTLHGSTHSLPSLSPRSSSRMEPSSLQPLSHTAHPPPQTTAGSCLSSLHSP